MVRWSTTGGWKEVRRDVNGGERGGRPGARAPGSARSTREAGPIRAELLTLERLAERAHELANEQRWTSKPAIAPSPLLGLVTRAQTQLEGFETRMAEALRSGRAITLTTEWLLDNSYLVEEQIRLIREDFPSGYAGEMPRLTAGPLADQPRAYEIAVTLVAHTDSRLDEEDLRRFLAAYQDVQPLDLGEVWALPILLRIALVENLRRLAALVERSSQSEQAADDWADSLLIVAQDRPEGLAAQLKELGRQSARLSPSFYLRLMQRLQDQETSAAPIMTWLERRVSESGVSLEAYVADVQQRRAANQVSVANAITSLRFLAALDWKAFFEENSFVEQVLRQDPIGIYEQMDFTSRDRYRHAVETIAKRCPVSEIDVAEAAVSCALEALQHDPTDTVTGHVGYHLVSAGRYSFETSVRYKPRPRERAYRGVLRFRGTIYWGAIALVTFVLEGLLAWWALGAGTAVWGAAVAVLLALVPLSDFAVTTANRLAALIWPARPLLKIDAAHPVADVHRTLAVTSALLSSVAEAQELIGRLEVAYLGNTDPNVHFGLLGDFHAADKEHLPGDAPIAEAARVGIDELNERYAEDGKGPFHLFIRGRRFDEGEDHWMGWERKRGALVELNRLLRGYAETSFTTLLGDASFLPGVTFVLTLDADTALPRDTARRLISTIAHPLQRARFDAQKRLVTRGYGLVQPHVGVSLPSARKSHYAHLYAGVAGIDTYSGAISDTYQDVFGEGSFTGKGIYEVNVFLAVLEGRIPEDTLLSHDLLEGNFLRVALASDVYVFDDYPSSYMAQTARMHRWVRGDWQTLPWLRRTVPNEDGTRSPNPLSFLHQWKLVDNLRRSLIAPTTVAFVAVTWLLVPRPTWVMPAIVFALFFAPAYMRIGDLALFYPRGFSPGNAVRATWQDFTCDLRRSGLALTVLPHLGQAMLDAIGRSLWRQFVTRRHMLEWVTAADVELAQGARLSEFVRRMLPASVVASLLLVPALVVHPQQAFLIVPAMLTWLSAPLATFLTSGPLPADRAEPTAQDQASMRRLARKTWRYFTAFVTSDDHWLVPDNFQEDPTGVIAHRTSPTNIGLQLLACLTGYDLGWSSIGDLVERVNRTLSGMAGLELFRGHFYNWYDTVTLRPLRPTYVSTVDSGNLAGHLITLRVGLLEASESAIIGMQVIEGLADTVSLAVEAVLDNHGGPPSEAAVALRQTLEEMVRRLAIEKPPRDLAMWHALLSDVWRLVSTLPERMATLEAQGAPLAEPAAAAIRDVVSESAVHLRDLERYACWAPLIAEAPPALREAAAGPLKPIFDNVPSLVGLAEGLAEALDLLEACAADPPGATDEERAAVGVWCGKVHAGITSCRPAAIELLAHLRLAGNLAKEVWQHTDFTLLYDHSREVFSIGFNVAEGRLDNSFYDMLASECRLASYLAVAKGDVPQRHWFRLARALTRTDFGYALISWNASMFEYLMPLLVMPSWPDTLLDDTYHAVVRRQIQYGRQRGVPWGVSESAFNARDASLTYQYQAFGVPGLGLKRGLSDDAVVAPYATILALPVDLRASLANLRELSRQGGEGRYGLYEAIDYTPGRVPAGRELAVVRSFFAHHQGMSLVTLGNMVTGFAMQRRFAGDPIVESAELLLQEKVPRHVVPARPHVEEVEFVRSIRELPPAVSRSYPTADTASPATHFLSNGRYSVMITNAGGGYSRWEDLAVNRYREDITRDCWGMFFYLRDRASGAVWSSAYQPTLAEPDDYHVTFSADKAEFRRMDGEIETHTEVVVSPEHDVEVRRITLTNHGRRPREIEVTSYFEISLADQSADQAHRTFSNLFVETQKDEQHRALLFSRRPRSADERRVWGVHVLACEDPDCAWDVETDRARFLGRLRTPVDPVALHAEGPLSGTVGAVLDPVCAIRQTVHIGPGESARLVFSTGVAETREQALALAEAYHDVRAAQRAADMAWTSSQIELRDLGISPDEAVVFQRLAARLLLTDPHSRLKVKTPVENRLPISRLWGLGISGDNPILLVKIEDPEEMSLVRQALLAHQYWRRQGLAVDLVVLNNRPTAYSEELDGRLHILVRTGHALQLMDKPGGVFLRRADQIDPDVRNLLDSVARAVLVGDGGPIALQLDQRAHRPALPDTIVPKRTPEPWPPEPFERPALAFDNGYGGFDNARNEYVIVLEGDLTTPAPWINVIANPDFGTIVSEAGIGCTWAINSHENRLTTWNNDPVSDGSGEAFYVRDEETGEFWSPTPLPVRGPEPYVVRHGRGYSVFEHASHGLRHELTWFVPPDEPVRVARLTLTNDSDRPRSLSVSHFVEWSLGSSRSLAQHRVVTWWDPQASMLMAHNWFNADFPGRPSFLACDRELDSHTASRTEFVGRNRQPADPAAMHRRGLGAEAGRYHDNCGALMCKLTLEPGETATLTFLLGQAETADACRALAERYRSPGVVAEALAAVKAFWDDLLGTVRISTPDAALDQMVNGPLPYQTLACRIWGRTALYQSSGAYGFRDQLQDTLALLLARPDITRAQIVEASRHQFEQGDVQHWWHPVSNRGVRTRIVDDRHWLAYVTAAYLEATGDTSVLDEETPFLEAPGLTADQDDVYLEPLVSPVRVTVYEHCVRALDSARPMGAHGLPLMGGADWNDGMNRVGHEGRGESVWMAWFLDVTLRRFAEVAEARGDGERAAAYRAWAKELVHAVEKEAWDGAWYRRAYFDDGTPLGTRSATECRIDSIAQSWSVISGSGDRNRALRAMGAVEEKLVRWEDGLIALLAPPFDVTPLDPGYIKGYVPGVRENGGQYTHAALWVVLAYALLGDGDTALSLLDLLNPINHSSDRESADTYTVEPYAVAADVYAVEPHVGRGGWTWYTGSASWFYNVAVCNIVGLRVLAEDGVPHLAIDPCIPKTWPGLAATYRFGGSTYEVRVENPRGVNRGVESVELDGERLPERLVPLVDDGASHDVRVVLLGG